MDFSLYGVPIAALIVGLVEVAKRQGLPVRFASPLALALGLLFALLARLEDPSLGTWLQMALQGLVTGLVASGLYSGVKSAVLGR